MQLGIFMKEIETGFFFIIFLVLLVSHCEMTFSSNGWLVTQEMAADPWYTQCVYYHNARLFTYKIPTGGTCPTRLNRSLATGSKGIMVYVWGTKS